VLEVALARMGYGVQPLGEAVMAEQQRIADTFHRIGLLPKPITVRDVVWKAAA
jgi:sulfonate transport system substrate-binding protein